MSSATIPKTWHIFPSTHKANQITQNLPNTSYFVASNFNYFLLNTYFKQPTLKRTAQKHLLNAGKYFPYTGINNCKFVCMKRQFNSLVLQVFLHLTEANYLTDSLIEVPLIYLGSLIVPLYETKNIPWKCKSE